MLAGLLIILGFIDVVVNPDCWVGTTGCIGVNVCSSSKNLTSPSDRLVFLLSFTSLFMSGKASK